MFLHILQWLIVMKYQKRNIKKYLPRVLLWGLWRKIFLIKSLHKKWSFPLRISSVNINQIRSFPLIYLVTVTKEIINGKLHFLCSDLIKNIFRQSFLPTKLGNSGSTEVDTEKYSQENVFWKYTANLQEITHAEVWLQLSSNRTLA